MLNDYQYLFVLTFGRSGSTLLMKLLNSLPGYRIRGENWNALFNLYKATDNLAETRKAAADSTTDVNDPWYGASVIDADQFRDDCLNSFVRNALVPQPGDRVIGFKEVRNQKPQMTKDRFMGYVAFILTYFPNARIILNTRDVDSVAQSGWYRQMPKNTVRDRLIPTIEWYHEVAADEPRCFVIDYADVVSKGQRLHDLFAWLGETYDEAAVQAVLDIKLDHARKVGDAPDASILERAKRFFG